MLESIAQAVVSGNDADMEALVKAALNDGNTATTVLQEGLIPGMVSIGEQMKNGDAYITEVLLSARAMKVGMEIVKPLLMANESFEYKGKVVIGTVRGDLHDIGKSLVVTILEGNGYEVIDLGMDISAEKFTQAMQDTNAQILGLSAMLTTTMLEMGKVVESLEAAGMRDKVKVLIGGAPTSDDFKVEIKADAWAVDATTGAEICNAWVAKN